MTVIETILLCAGGMPLFDALIHAFGTAGTGGFSNKALSVGAYNSPYFEIVIGVFMLLFGINFNLYYFLLLRHFREAFASEEMHVYLGIVAFSTLTITANIAGMYDSVGTALRTAFFQVSSIVTTTGYATADFNLWPTYSRTVIVILTFVGACAGSTAGGLKVSRVIILFKAARQDLNKMLHSHAVTTVRFEGKPLDEKTLRGVHNYFNIYMLLLTLSVLLLSLDGFDLVTTFTSVATCLNNVGPGLEMVGPMGSFADFSAPAKLLLAFDMLAGRLELYPMLALFAPRLWRKRINAMHEARAKLSTRVLFLFLQERNRKTPNNKEKCGRLPVKRAVFPAFLLLTLRIANRPHTAQYGTGLSRNNTNCPALLPGRCRPGSARAARWQNGCPAKFAVCPCSWFRRSHT